ncbi:MAG: N-acetylmuramic acid 6-phosphate etherase [Verrucomicrobia bacterium]|nr:N-acetylmuramic acid 6-phosphate etherase [Verrucomicrobiota bacterium]
MNASRSASATPACLGVECGATHTVALLTDAAGRLLRRAEFGPANLQLLTDAQLARHFRAIRARMPLPLAVAIGMAGARTAGDRQRICAAAARVWPGIPCYGTNDLETGLMAAEGAGKRAGGQQAGMALPRVLVVSGTGSCCFGRAPAGWTVKVGGWGHLLDDKGSGYDIAMGALQALVHVLDLTGSWPPLGRRILRRLQLNDPEELVAWTQHAGKSDIASLAVDVFAAANRHDTLADRLLTEAADRLAADAAACARRIARPGRPVEFVLAGSVLLKQTRFAAELARRLRRRWPGARVAPLHRESAWGAVTLARHLLAASAARRPTPTSPPSKGPSPKASPETGGAQPADAAAGVPDRAPDESPTEQRNPRSMNLDRMRLGDAVALMLSEDAKVPVAVLAQRRPIERAIRLIVRALRRGGRLFYLGAGTSGRLGVLDASECPPTFGVPPDRVQGIMAGGQTALWQSIEGAEDDADAGARAVAYRGVGRRDVLVGIAASGRTPFVWGGLRAARQRGAATVLLSFNPALAIGRGERPDVVIAPEVGPEVLTGSTRLKAGTATKLVLNMFTTLAMVRLGKVRSNLMVDVKPSNAKLRDRAVRIVQALTGCDRDTARRALRRARWNIRRACARVPER